MRLYVVSWLICIELNILVVNYIRASENKSEAHVFIFLFAYYVLFYPPSTLNHTEKWADKKNHHSILLTTLSTLCFIFDKEKKNPTRATNQNTANS